MNNQNHHINNNITNINCIASQFRGNPLVNIHWSLASYLKLGWINNLWRLLRSVNKEIKS